MCAPCVWPLPWLAAPGAWHRARDFLIGRALVFALWNSDRFSQARFLISSGVLRYRGRESMRESHGGCSPVVVVLCRRLRVRYVFNKITQTTTPSSHSFPRVATSGVVVARFRLRLAATSGAWPCPWVKRKLDLDNDLNDIPVHAKAGSRLSSSTPASRREARHGRDPILRSPNSCVVCTANLKF